MAPRVPGSQETEGPGGWSRSLAAVCFRLCRLALGAFALRVLGCAGCRGHR